MVHEGIAYIPLPLPRKIFTNRDFWAYVANKMLHPPVQIILQYGELVAEGLRHVRPEITILKMNYISKNF